MGINMQAGDVVDAETFKMWEEQLLDDAGLSVGQMRARMNALNAQTKITFEQATSPEAFRSRVRSGYYAVGDDPVARLKNFNLSDERVRINAISDQYALNRADSIAFRKTELEAQVIVSQNTLQAQALKSSADYLFKLIDNFAGDNPDELFRSASFRAAYESLQGISALALNMSLVELEASVKTQSSLQFRSWLGGWFGLVKDKVAFTALAFERNIAEAKASGSTAAAARVEAEKRMEPGANDLYNRYIGQ
jgi:hypothetical protein